MKVRKSLMIELQWQRLVAHRPGHDLAHAFILLKRGKFISIAKLANSCSPR